MPLYESYSSGGKSSSSSQISYLQQYDIRNIQIASQVISLSLLSSPFYMYSSAIRSWNWSFTDSDNEPGFLFSFISYNLQFLNFEISRTCTKEKVPCYVTRMVWGTIHHLPEFLWSAFEPRRLHYPQKTDYLHLVRADLLLFTGVKLNFLVK